jgi:hypothetical protein
VPYLFKRISGVRGQITIPDLGAVIGVMEKWELTRRGADSGEHRYDLRAVFSFVNPLLLNDEDYAKEAKLVIGRSREIRAHLAEAEETVLTGRVLLARGVKLYERQG